MARIRHYLLAAAFAGLVAGPVADAQAAGTATVQEAVVVTVDQAKVFRVSSPAATVIIGNPSIVDATVEDDQTIILTGRSFGVTNLIILDVEGNAIFDRQVTVNVPLVNTLRIYRRTSRETYACAPSCEPTLTIGDDLGTFGSASEQIEKRNEISQSSIR